MLTLEQFNDNAYFAVLSYINDLLLISPDVFRADFTLSVDSTNNVIIEYWDVIGVSQPTILQVRDTITMIRINLCILNLS